MTRIVRDDGLPLPDHPGPVPFAGLQDPELARIPATDGADVRLDGERGWLRVTRQGSTHAVLEGRPAVSGLRWTDGVVVNQLASPGLLRRETVVGSRTVEEAVLLTPTLPLVALQRRWSGQPGTDPIVAGSATVTLTLLPEAATVKLRVEGPLLVARAADDDRHAVLALVPGGRWAVREGPGSGVRLVGEVDAAHDEEGGASVLLTVAGRGRVARSLTAAPHLPAHARAATAAPAEGLRLRTGHRTLDEGVDWARARLLRGGALVEASPASDEDRFWTVLGALGAGVAGEPGDRTASGPDVFSVLLAGRAALATGRQGPALACAEALLQAEPGRDVPTFSAPLGPVALEMLADGLRHGAPENMIETLRARAEATGDTPPQGSGLRLPMLGGPGGAPTASSAEATLAALLSDRAPPGTGDGAGDEILRAWGWALAGRADDAWALWRGVMARGLEDGAAGPGSWDGWAEAPAAPTAGRLVAALVHGILGWTPDAPVGRARLAPRLPSHLTSFLVEGLTVGDVRVTLSYEGEGAEHRFRVEPTAGRAPLTLVWEPSVPVRPPLRLRLDGQRVELETQSTPDGSVVSVQVALDEPRTLEIGGRS